MNAVFVTITDALPLLMRGTVMTVQLWVAAGCISVAAGSLWGVIRAQRLRVCYLSTFVDGVSFVLRGIPFYVQLLIAYFVIPGLLGGVDISPFVASTVSLGLCSAAYVSQIIKSGLDAIPIGEWEAAYVLGYSERQALRVLMLPRAFRFVMPALRGEFDQLLKSTSIISTIGMFELTNAARNIVERDLRPLPIYAAVAVIYLLMSVAFNAAATKAFERKAYD
jgi:His/Glu/Gln/Arg/opine family amino acid ABC transporter permease subunit